MRRRRTRSLPLSQPSVAVRRRLLQPRRLALLHTRPACLARSALELELARAGLARLGCPLHRHRCASGRRCRCRARSPLHFATSSWLAARIPRASCSLPSLLPPSHRSLFQSLIIPMHLSSLLLFFSSSAVDLSPSLRIKTPRNALSQRGCPSHRGSTALRLHSSASAPVVSAVAVVDLLAG